MRGSEAFLEAPRDRGVEVVFGYPGGAIVPLYDALIGSGIRHVLVRQILRLFDVRHACLVEAQAERRLVC
ncbi:MAG: hypothetical protein FJ171_06600 [Gammaproteobacteria bacterium]|nr:hypothetical protein [Gammaproteobacteria bacterium]